MGTYTAAGCSTHRTLTAGTVDTVTLDQAYGYVEVQNQSTTAPIYFTVDRGPNNEHQQTPAVAADGTYVVGPSAFRVVADDQQARLGYTTPVTVVRLISAVAAAYDVTGLDSP